MVVRAKSRAFRDLKVWEKAHKLTLDVYGATKAMPRHEAFGLTSQIRRAASSIPSNIAEGCGRGGGDLGRFFRIASGSASELEYQILLARDLDYIDGPACETLSLQIQEVRRMLTAYAERLSDPDFLLTADG
jgi:four helix bundle protein